MPLMFTPTRWGTAPLPHPHGRAPRFSHTLRLRHAGSCGGAPCIWALTKHTPEACKSHSQPLQRALGSSGQSLPSHRRKIGKQTEEHIFCLGATLGSFWGLHLALFRGCSWQCSGNQVVQEDQTWTPTCSACSGPLSFSGSRGHF